MIYSVKVTRLSRTAGTTFIEMESEDHVEIRISQPGDRPVNYAFDGEYMVEINPATSPSLRLIETK